jgi:hypothetical protein
MTFLRRSVPRAATATATTTAMLLMASAFTPSVASAQAAHAGDAAGSTTPSVSAHDRAPALSPALSPVFSVAPRTLLARRGPRGALMNRGQRALWLSANVHALLPSNLAPLWPAPVRLALGTRDAGGTLPREYIVALDLDAAHLPGSHPAWQRTKQLLHFVRLPGPAFVMTASGTRLVGLYW